MQGGWNGGPVKFLEKASGSRALKIGSERKMTVAGMPPNAERTDFIAARMRRVVVSASNAAGQRARELAAMGRDVVNLTIGEPHFDTPRNILNAASIAMNEGQTRYTTVDGTPALKRAIASKFLRDNALRFSSEQIIAGAGAKQIIFGAMLCTVEEGDEVIIPTPCWVSYPDMAKLVGGRPVLLPCTAETNFKLSPERLRNAITPRTKWLILNSPSNPTGATYSEAELRTLGEALLEFPHVWILSDDIYEHIIYDGLKFSTMACAVPGLADRTLTVNGVSKAYSMTGWRLGFAGGPKLLVREMAKLQSQSTSNPCSISQAAAVEALEGPQDFIAVHTNEFRDNRDLMVLELSNIVGITCEKPDGAFYVFPSCAGLIGKKTPDGKTIETDDDFILYLLEAGVATIAGSSYGLPSHFRLSFATSKAAITEGCRRIRDACRQLR
jgi:aspartate aminotransferase